MPFQSSPPPGRIPLGYKITNVPNTKHINLRTQEIKNIKITEYDTNSKEYEMITDLIMLYKKKDFEGYKNMSIRNLSDYIEKKYNKKEAGESTKLADLKLSRFHT